jgi:hypothetical protein
MTGFYIKKLCVTGVGKQDACIEFDKGLNVVSGASDTGKSYIFSCLEYMLGREESPKVIPESAGYSNVYLEIKERATNKSITIHRKIGDSSAQIKYCTINDFPKSQFQMSQLAVKASSKTEANLSRFLLRLCGLDEVKLKKNKENEKANLTFTDIRKLTCIHEQRIITEESPFYYDSQYITRTKSQSLIKFFLSGKDDSELKTHEKGEITETRIRSKIEVLKDQLEFKLDKYRESTEALEGTPKVSADSEIDDLNMRLLETNQELESLGKHRNQIFQSIEQKKRTLFQKQELKDRFQLLAQHYNSDLERLQFVNEGNNILEQLQNKVCPVCYQEIHEEHEEHLTTNDKVAEAVNAETTKIQVKLEDLSDTNKELELTISALTDELNIAIEKYDAINLRIINELNPQQDFIKKRLSKIVVFERLSTRILVLEEEIDEIQIRIQELEEDLLNSPKDSKATINISKLHIDKLNKSVERRLTKWNYDTNVKTNFDPSYKVFDFSIGTKLRNSYGKGKRGVSYTAAIIGLMDYCKLSNTPFTSNLIFDSPLTAYQENKADKGKKDVAPTDIINSFYSDLASISQDVQIIILDNKSPNAEVSQKINHIEFTGVKGTGRFGFFPVV